MANTDKFNIEAATAVFGAHPEDVLGVIVTATEVCAQLEALFKSIKSKLAEDGGCSRQVESLVDVGIYLASDMGNYIDGRREECTDNLVLAGILCGLVDGKSVAGVSK